MSKKTAMMKLYDMLDKGQISEIAEIKEFFIMLEREQIITAFCEGYDHDGDNYDGAEISYYNRTYKGGSNE